MTQVIAQRTKICLKGHISSTSKDNQNLIADSNLTLNFAYICAVLKVLALLKHSRPRGQTAKKGLRRECVKMTRIIEK